MYFSAKLPQISLCRAPFVIFIKSFLATGHVKVVKKIAIKLLVSDFLKVTVCHFILFEGVS